jgi:probable phosphoglycerate mutase
MDHQETTKTRFLLVRAGSTEFDQHGRILGALDIPLSVQGEAEILQTVKQLSGIPVTAVYSSTCLAARQSAKLIAHAFKVKLVVEAGLTNLNCGLWHGKSLEELRETQPTLFKQWKEHPEQVCPPGGEPVASAMSRVSSALNKIRRKVKAGVVVLVAPDPLSCFIRQELQPHNDEATKPSKLKCGEWAMLESSPAVT